jgi:hypothetical protein
MRNFQEGDKKLLMVHQEFLISEFFSNNIMKIHPKFPKFLSNISEMLSINTSKISYFEGISESMCEAGLTGAV